MRRWERALAVSAAFASLSLLGACGAGPAPPGNGMSDDLPDAAGKPHADAAAKDLAAPVDRAPADAASAKDDAASARDDAVSAKDDAAAAADVALPPDAAARPDLPVVSGPGMRLSHRVAPKATDPAIDKWPAEHISVVDTRVPAVGKLFVFLAGGNGEPSSTVDMLDFAAARGLHAIGPSFTTDVLVADVCPKDPDPNCSGNVRKEVLEGMDTSPHLVVTPANSLDNRITKLLAYLAKSFPAEGWGVYLESEAGQPARVRWSEVIVAGRSLGASEAACVGKRRAVHRVQMHSGPGDSRLEMHAASAPWLEEPSLTPGDRMYGFSNTGDPGHADQLRAWAALGLPGNPVSVDDHKPPYAGSHQLITSFGAAGGAHGSTTPSGKTNTLPDGSYRFAPVWTTMMGL
jgi:hypothetical protein